MKDWVDEIEAQIDDTVPYYVKRLIAEIRRLRSHAPSWDETAKGDAREFLYLYGWAMQVFQSDADWETKYDVIFPIVRKARDLYAFDWADPDTTYEDDVRAVMVAFQEKATELKKVLHGA